MQRRIAGTWELRTWRRFESDGRTSFPFGKSPRGLLIYAPDGRMAVQMVAADRPRIETADALGGAVEQRASAYSTCLAYFGRYEVRDDQVIHRVEGSLFPNWSETVQARPFVFEGEDLVLQVKAEDGRVTNEIVWKRMQESAE